MDWLTFITKLVEALAWPSVIIAVLLLIRKELPTIARSLRRLKIKDIELEFGEAAKAVANEAKQYVPQTQPDVKISGQLRSEIAARISSIAELAPRAAILEAWLQVEVAAADVVRKYTSERVPSKPAPSRLRDGLMSAEILNARQAVIFNELRGLRNEAVHVPEAQFTREAVASYIEAALDMASFLESISGKS